MMHAVSSIINKFISSIDGYRYRERVVQIKALISLWLRWQVYCTVVEGWYLACTHQLRSFFCWNCFIVVDCRFTVLWRISSLCDISSHFHLIFCSFNLFYFVLLSCRLICFYLHLLLFLFSIFFFVCKLVSRLSVN